MSVRRKRNAAAAFVVAAMVLGAGASASAGHLDWLYSKPREPDVTSEFIYVSYDPSYSADEGRFLAVGTATHLDMDGVAPPDHPIYGGGFEIDMTLYKEQTDSWEKGQPTGGTLRITGTVPDVPGMDSGTLLTGVLDPRGLQKFGFGDEGGELFEFVFDVREGDLIPYWGSSQAAVILDAVSSGFSGDFTVPFDNDITDGLGFGLGVADTFPIPEPNWIAVWSFLGPAGGLALVRVVRKRRRTASAR